MLSNKLLIFYITQTYKKHSQNSEIDIVFLYSIYLYIFRVPSEKLVDVELNYKPLRAEELQIL